MTTRPSAEVRPFPFAALDALARSEVEAAARMRRAVRSHVRLDVLARTISEAAGERVEILVRKYRRLEPSRAGADGVAVAFEIDGHTPVVVEVESALAAALASRALQRPPPRVVDPARPAPPALAGAFAAIALACLRRAHAGASFRVLAAGPAGALVRDLAHRHPESTSVALTVVLGADAFDARVTVPDGAALAPRAIDFDGAVLERLGDAPIAIPIVAATCLAARSEIAELSRGDAFVVPTLSLERVALVPARGERGLSAGLAEDGRLVVRGLVESHPWDREEPKMSGDTSSRTTAEVLEDAAVVVRVELGAVEMKAREWAALAPGDVVALGRKIGDPAVLRIGGVEVARGELVQIDGEYGVRILGRAEER